MTQAPALSSSVPIAEAKQAGETVIRKLADRLPDRDARSALFDRLHELHHDLHTRAIRSYNNRRNLLNGYSYDVFYDWDTYFENCYLAHLGEPRYCRSNTEAFLDQQLANGFVSRSLGLPRLRQHYKPFLAQMVWLGVRQGDDPRWLEGRYLERLEKYLEHWRWHCDYDCNGLSVWDSADHSGMDNQDRRAGVYHEDAVEGVDLNVYLAREFDAMANILTRLGEADRAEAYRQRACERRDAINEHLWNEAAGFYFDRHEAQDEHRKVFTIAGFIPLWDGTAPQDRADRLIDEHLTDREAFWLEYPVTTWSKREPDYYQMRRDHECNWRGPCWVPTNYMVFQGLRRYGRTELAEELAYRTAEMALRETTTREFYNAETGVGQGLAPFWGWSALAYAMPLEFECGVDPTRLDPPEQASADAPSGSLEPCLTQAWGFENPLKNPVVTEARPDAL
ncbi:MAG: trehalase family glycosidase [Planctomycetota bacterium]